MQANGRAFNRTGPGLRIIGGALVAALSACNMAPPSGQTIARVDGVDVTIAELEHETSRASTGNAAVTDQQLAEQIVRRKALASAAIDMGLEQDPEYHFELRKHREDLLVDALYRKLMAEAEKPSSAQISAYIDAKPWRFTERKILYLASGADEAVPDLMLDTFAFDEEPPFPILTIDRGERMLWEGRVRYVVQRQSAPLEGSQASDLARDQIMARAVDERLETLYKGLIQSGQLQYAVGYGPSGWERRVQE